jgi:hypothetical protein
MPFSNSGTACEHQSQNARNGGSLCFARDRMEPRLPLPKAEKFSYARVVRDV